MHTKQTDEILSAMSFLYQQIEEIENYPDKSLFFQDPRVIEGWLMLVRAIKQMEKWDTSKDETDWEQRSDTYVVPLLAKRELFLKFKNLYRTYYDLLKQLWDGYSGWIDGECISADGIEALITDKYDQVLDVEDFGLHLERVNTRSIDARYAVFKTLSDIFDLLQAVMNRGGQVVIDMNPSDEDIAKAIDNDLREWTLSFGKSLFKDMKEDMNRHFKTHPTDHNTPELWGEILRADEDALKMAMRQQLTTCEDTKQEHWGEDMKKQMDENNELMRLIYSSCYTEELFDLSMDKSIQQFISLLTPDNLDMFYEIIVRRSLIQCEMFPELKAQHEAWLNKTRDLYEDSEDNLLSDARQSNLDDNAPKIVMDSEGNMKMDASQVPVMPHTEVESEEESPQDEENDKNIASVTKCFKFPNDFIKQKVKAIVNDYYHGIAANLALIEVTLFDHNQLKKRNAHKALLKSLIAWDIIDQLSDEELKKTTNGMANKLGFLPSVGYMEWDGQNYVNDKKTCTDIGNDLGPTIPYSREKEK